MSRISSPELIKAERVNNGREIIDGLNVLAGAYVAFLAQKIPTLQDDRVAQLRLRMRFRKSLENQMRSID